MAALIQDLSRPENFPGPPSSRVELITTHGSWVFLTDEEAWKIKRPVDYGFLNFTTLERRRHFCHEEVRLNRRLAPEVYLGVEAVRLDARGHSLVRPGEIVDYAVRMRRLPERTSALQMLRGGTLGTRHLARLARALARFYREAAQVPHYGALDAVRVNARENFDQVRPFVGRLLQARMHETVREWQERQLSLSADRFEGRVGAGRIRDGHGDLRLEHVYFIGDEPVVIDCIDFNERIRCGDVASDVAFLAMDLAHEKRSDLAAWLLWRFAMESNDYDLYSVVDFYVCYRAWVRGKVACLVAADPSTPDGKRRRKEDEARSFFIQALACTRPWIDESRLVAVGGLIGAGKTTLAEALSLRLQYPVVGSDPIRKHLAGIPLTRKGGPRIYTPDFSRRTFREVFRCASVVLESGRGVILDATFRSRALRREARDVARRHRCPFLLVEVRCGEELLRRRLRRRARTRSVSDAGEALLARFQQDFEPVTELGPEESIRVDGNRPVDDGCSAVLDRLRRG